MTPPAPAHLQPPASITQQAGLLGAEAVVLQAASLGCCLSQFPRGLFPAVLGQGPASLSAGLTQKLCSGGHFWVSGLQPSSQRLLRLHPELGKLSRCRERAHDAGSGYQKELRGLGLLLGALERVQGSRGSSVSGCLTKPLPGGKR